ncbi:hypothetical protein S245_039396, partial [Arachis hypogaea]
WNSSAANATKFQKYLAAENGGGADLVANCTSASASGWETFKLWWVSDTSFNFRVFNKQFLRMEKQFQDIDGLEDIKLIFSSFEILLKMKLSSADFCPSPPEGLMKEKGEARKEKLRSEGKEKNFEWAWQHPVESLAVRKAAANFKSLSGVANKIKLAYTMLTLPSWQRNIYLGKANHNLKSVLAITNMKKRKNGGFRSMWRREKKSETQVAHVIRTKSVQFMPFNLSFFLTLSAVMWFAYGLFLSDICIAISTPTLSLPNVLDFALGVLQMLLYAIYRNAAIYHIKKLTIWDTVLTLSMGSGSNKDSSTTSCDNNSIIEAPPSNGRTLDTFGQRTSIYRGVTRHRWTGRYEAHLWDNSCRREGQSRKGRQGGYDKEDKATRAYDLAALKSAR